MVTLVLKVQLVKTEQTEMLDLKEMLVRLVRMG